jgi:hypothetical protein
MCVAAAQVVSYAPYTTPLTTASSTASNASGVYIDQNMQYAHYLAPPQQYAPAVAISNSRNDTHSAIDQNGTASGKLEVRLSGHARAVSLPAGVVMQSPGSNSDQTNGHYDVEQRMYGMGLEASE